MEFITSASAPPPLPPSVKQYQSQAVIHLTSDRRGSASGDGQPGLFRSLSRGSLGRRSSSGGGSESGGGLRRVLSRGEGESGGGLRRVLSRGDKSGADGAGRRSSEGNVLKQTDESSAGGAPLQRTKSAELKNGKWISPIMAGVAGNNLVLILAVDSHLVPFGTYDEHQHQFKRRPSSNTAPTAAAPATHPEAEHSSGGGGIGATIKKIFRRSSSSQQGTTAHGTDVHPTTTSGAESAVSDETAVNAPLNTLEGHHQLDEQVHDKSYPAYVHGEPVKYIVVPLGALDYKTITLKEEKGVWVVKVPVTGFFHRLVEPALNEIGQGPDEGWGRSGEIEFLFDSKNWIGAKDEAELLHFSLMSALNPTGI
ncbi:hypothetical protein NliqN6_2410 [Naganishia liquefaciens]|uniref:Uncharacterized protein n=1 Tax=Naganishia liquefaciens TaxID=104408 RepID=A0A8H3TRV7_9TREE|nr:hypothetical protein NliqN6_2410 [Naganishia liquefaciens]